MRATNFDESFISKINEILKFVLENEYSDFYQKKYKDLSFYPIKNWEDFQKIPMLTKDEIVSTPLRERAFISEQEITHYTFSSGTTNHRKPTICPHCSVYDNTNFNEEKIAQTGARKIYVLLPGTSFVFYKAITSKTQKIKMIPGDPQNLALATSIAKELAVDGLMLTPTILDLLIKELLAIQFPLSEICWISLGGEFCSERKLAIFKSFFPNATFAFRFGSSEIGPRGYRCPKLENEKPSYFHPMKDSLIEILTEENEAEEAEKNGEIIHTDLKIKAFPLIRYKTGDAASLVNQPCTCGAQFKLNLGGRLKTDILKFAGATLYIQSIEDSLAEYVNYFESTFQMHVHEKQVESLLKPQLELHLKLKAPYADLQNHLMFIENLIEKISSNLQLTKKYTLKQLIERESFLPLKIVFVENFEKASKTKYIVSHLN